MFPLDIMGFEEGEYSDMYKNVAGIMHMGEMKFKQRPREEQAEVDTEDGNKFRWSNYFSADTRCKLF